MTTRISKFLLATLAVGFVGTSAHAADVVHEEPPAPLALAAPSTWTGFYVGVIGGYATGDFDYSLGYAAPGVDLGDSASLDGEGGFVGGQVGYDHQFDGGLVLGAVADIAYGQIDADFAIDVAGFGTARAESELKYLGTVRARLGYDIEGRFLPYVHGGFAYGEAEQTLSLDGVGSIDLDDGDVKTGYVVGAGLEYAVTESVSVQAEYGFTDLGKDTIDAGELLGSDRLGVDEEIQIHLIKAGVNFRF